MKAICKICEHKLDSKNDKIIEFHGVVYCEKCWNKSLLEDKNTTITTNNSDK
jgi:hypothetical protein